MKKVFRSFIDFLEIMAAAIAIVFLLLNFVLISVVVTGSSMEPTLWNGEFGLSFIISRKININRFDIVVIDSSQSDDLLVKRVIGLPGEVIRYENNQLYINDEAIEEEYLVDSYTNNFEVFLGDDEYFCLGDNRDVSRDSRYYGPFTSSEIKSSHVLILYPFSSIGWNK